MNSGDSNLLEFCYLQVLCKIKSGIERQFSSLIVFLEKVKLHLVNIVMNDVGTQLCVFWLFLVVMFS